MIAVWAAVGAASAQAAAPICNDASYTVESGKQLVISGLCSDADGDAVSSVPQVVTFPAHGSLGPGPSGGGTYTSHFNYVGPDSFTFKVQAGGEDSNVATVSITVTPQVDDDPPQCFDTFFTAYNDGASTDVYGSCFDPDTQTAQLSASVVDPPQHGQLSGTLGLQGFGATAGYTPDAGYTGPDTITYRVSDGARGSALATITLNVVSAPAGNDTPTCPESHAYVEANTGSPPPSPLHSIDLVGNCIDDENDPISYALAPPSVTGGSLQFLSSNSVRYTPATSTPVGFIDELGYTAKDPYHRPVHFSAKITVTAPGDNTFETAPEASPADPYTASVTSPNPGPVYIDTREVTETPPQGFAYLNQEIDITAPPASDPSNPLRFVFKLDSSELAALNLTPSQVKVFRNNVEVPDCASPGAGVASPTPCIDARQVQTGGPGDPNSGDLWITALTMQASVWNLGVAEIPDADGDGLPDEADNCVNTPNPGQVDEDANGIGAACDTKERPTSKADCGGDGWKAFNGRLKFRNQGDCVSFVATLGTNQPRS